MKRLLTLLAACIAACAATAQSRIETFTFRSALLGAEKTCSVYLPAGYDDSGRSYPVLYLLHGASGYHGDWAEKGNMRQIADEAIAAGTALPMIVVMPDASGTGENYTGDRMGYFDVPGWPYERFFFEEFVPAVERRYRICGDKARRAISGLSMGGGGTPRPGEISLAHNGTIPLWMAASGKPPIPSKRLPIVMILILPPVPPCGSY